MQIRTHTVCPQTPKVRMIKLSFLYATCRLVLFYISTKYQKHIPKGTGPTCHLVLFYISTKYHQHIPKGIRATERTQNLFHTKQRTITPKVKKPELPFLYMTCHLFLFCISTKYHQNIPKGVQVTEQTRS